jgi:hypothetical protein
VQICLIANGRDAFLQRNDLAVARHHHDGTNQPFCWRFPFITSSGFNRRATFERSHDRPRPALVGAASEFG